MENSKPQVVCRPNCFSLELMMDSQVLSMRITTHFADQNSISGDISYETDGTQDPCSRTKTSKMILVPLIIYKIDRKYVRKGVAYLSDWWYNSSRGQMHNNCIVEEDILRIRQCIFQQNSTHEIWPRIFGIWKGLQGERLSIC